MLSQIQPIVGQWYFDREKEQLFEVIDADMAQGFIDIQDFDGNIEELDVAQWYASAFELAQAPDDWTDPFDDIDPDELGYAARA